MAGPIHTRCGCWCGHAALVSPQIALYFSKQSAIACDLWACSERLLVCHVIGSPASGVSGVDLYALDESVTPSVWKYVGTRQNLQSGTAQSGKSSSPHPHPSSPHPHLYLVTGTVAINLPTDRLTSYRLYLPTYNKVIDGAVGVPPGSTISQVLQLSTWNPWSSVPAWGFCYKMVKMDTKWMFNFKKKTMGMARIRGRASRSRPWFGMRYAIQSPPFSFLLKLLRHWGCLGDNALTLSQWDDGFTREGTELRSFRAA